MIDEQKALALACKCAGRKMHHYALMGDDLPLKWSIVAHADTIMQYKALQAERDAQAAEIARLRVALTALVTAVTYADPPKIFNGVLCHEARVPVEFVTAARAALAQETQP